MSKKKLFIIIGAVVLTIAVAVTLFFIFGNKSVPLVASQPYDMALTLEQAEEDLAFIYDCVKDNHPCYLDESGLDITFDEAYAEAQSKLYEGMTVTDLWAVSAEMYCTLNDGHTIMTYRNTRTLENPERLSKGKVLSVDGVSGKELLERFKRYFPYEPQVEFYAESMLGTAMQQESWLVLMGIDTTDGVVIELETENGVEAVNFAFAYPENTAVSAESAPYFSYSVDEISAMGIFTLDECIVSDEYKAALESFFKEVTEKNADIVVVDLRNNGGGNSQVINEFMKYIDVESYYTFGGVDMRWNGFLVKNKATSTKNQKGDYVFSGKLYALTSHNTFSSAMDFAVTISDNGIGRIVGEAPGNMPTCYGDKLTFQAPNSGLLCNVSFKKFYRVDRTKNDIPLIPDIEMDSSEKQALLNAVISDALS